MKKIKLFPLLFLLFSGLIYAQNRPMVVGYLPTYSNWPNSIDNVDLNIVTHINVAFANPDQAGNLAVPATLTTVVQKAHVGGVLILISIGGGAATSDVYRTQLATQASTNTFVDRLINLVTTYNLDGVDVDIEGNILNGVDVTAAQYEYFVVRLKQELQSRNKLMTAALGNWFGNYLTTNALNQFDFINAMSYDAYGSWSGPGDHSTYDLAVGDYNYWTQTKGVAPEKLTIGLPFYGWGWGTYAGAYTYANLLNTFPGAENQDRIGSGNNMISYNGVETIRRKTAFAIENTGGVMIWELTQDIRDTRSLLRAIGEVINDYKVERIPYFGTPVSLPGRIEAENYDLGGQNFTYYDATPQNQGEAYRNDAVDIEVCEEGGYNVAYIVEDEWLEYSVDIQETRAYTIEISVATIEDDRYFHLELDGEVITENIIVPNTGGWQDWQTITVSNVQLSEGIAILKIVMDTGDFNIDYVNFLSTITSNNQQNATYTIQISPNPFNDYVNISGELIYKVELLNTSSVVLKTIAIKSEHHQIDLSDMQEGVYFLRIHTEEGFTIEKIVK